MACLDIAFCGATSKEKGKYILAIEADGATYHSSDTAEIGMNKTKSSQRKIRMEIS